MFGGTILALVASAAAGWALGTWVQRRWLAPRNEARYARRAGPAVDRAEVIMAAAIADDDTVIDAYVDADAETVRQLGLWAIVFARQGGQLDRDGMAEWLTQLAATSRLSVSLSEAGLLGSDE